MKPVQVSGTEHYAEEARELLKRYESISFDDAHRSVMDLVPREPCLVLDIGAGPGAMPQVSRLWAIVLWRSSPLRRCIAARWPCSGAVDRVA